MSCGQGGGASRRPPAIEPALPRAFVEGAVTGISVPGSASYGIHPNESRQRQSALGPCPPTHPTARGRFGAGFRNMPPIPASGRGDQAKPVSGRPGDMRCRSAHWACNCRGDSGASRGRRSLRCPLTTLACSGHVVLAARLQRLVRGPSLTGFRVRGEAGAGSGSAADRLRFGSQLRTDAIRQRRTIPSRAHKQRRQPGAWAISTAGRRSRAFPT